MSTCKDCLHYEVCQYHITEETDMTVNECSHFKHIVDYPGVVRCKDCAIPHNKWTGCPKLNGLIPPPNHFCSYGERNGASDE